MKQEKFNKLLKESGLPKEFSQKIDQIIRAINDHEERIKAMEVSRLNRKKD